MTEDEARAEAIRRWGVNAKVTAVNGGFSVGIGARRPVERGHGASWAEALAHAHQREASAGRPQLVGWWDGDPGLSIMVGCRDCRKSRIARLRVSVLPPLAAIVERADLAETNLLRRFRTACPHVPRTLAFDRTGLWLWVQRLPPGAGNLPP